MEAASTSTSATPARSCRIVRSRPVSTSRVTAGSSSARQVSMSPAASIAGNRGVHPARSHWPTCPGGSRPWSRIRSLSPSGAGRARRAPARTEGERAEFAALWAEAGVELRSGDHYYLCPFHPDHHPSLHIDADGCRFYCFGCGRGGGSGRLRRLVSGRPDRHRPLPKPGTRPALQPTAPSPCRAPPRSTS